MKNQRLAGKRLDFNRLETIFLRPDETRALGTRAQLSFLQTSGGKIRVRHVPSPIGPRLLFATDGPNVIEHYDALLEALRGRADVVIFEPPGTGCSFPAAGFDFSIDALTRACGEVLTAYPSRTLIFPCYLGFMAQQLSRTRASDVTRVVLPQVPSWPDMEKWADGVDPRRRLRTPGLGQALMRVGRLRVARSWYAASTGHQRFRTPFTQAAREAFDASGCFCLASLMQGLSSSPAPETRVMNVPTAVVWGERDRTHRRSDPSRSVPGATLVRFPDCGHSPELEAPIDFAQWLIDWHAGDNS